MNSIIKYIDDMPTFELVFFRALGSVVCCFFVLYKYKINIKGNQTKWLFYRAAAGLISMALFFKAIQIMPVASAVTLRYISPFFAAILAVMLLKEKMIKIQWLCLAVAFLGVVILKGFDARIDAIGLLIILMAAVFSGIVYMLIRKIGTNDHPIVVVNYFMCMSLIVSSLVCLFKWRTPLQHEIPWLISLGLFGFFAQLFMTKAMQREESNQIVPFKYVEVILTIIAAWILFSEALNVQSILAILMIITALIVNVRAKSKIV